MKVLLFENPQLVTEDQLLYDMSLLPKWRRDIAVKYRFLIDRVLCTKSYLLLKKGLYQEYGIVENPVFSYKANGKPILRDYPDICFNISHCKKGILCVISEQEVGCDIEEIPDKLELDLYEECLSFTEKQRILKSEKPCREFIKLWTMKEAFLKYTGEGICDCLSEILLKDCISNIKFDICQNAEGFIYTLCYEKGSV